MSEHKVSSSLPVSPDTLTAEQGLRDWVAPTIVLEPLQRAQSGAGLTNDGTGCS